MPNNTAATGDVYQVYRNVTMAPYKLGKLCRPCVCTDPGSQMSTTWTALPRLTSGIWKDKDLPSAPILTLGLDKPGAWSARFIHQVLKEKTGGKACEYKGPLPGPILAELKEAFPRYFVD